jgi:RNA polymerase sigma-70 factor, ECF subfamily
MRSLRTIDWLGILLCRKCLTQLASFTSDASFLVIYEPPLRLPSYRAPTKVNRKGGIRLAAEELPDWDAIVEQRARRVLAVAVRILGSLDDAEDVAQEVFIEAYRVHCSGPVQSWTGLLVRLATVRSLDRLRRRRPIEELRDTDRVTTLEPHDEATAAELAAWLRGAIRGLPEQQAAVFVMAHYGRLSREEIAAALAISLEGASAALYKARQHLLAELSVFQRGESR